MNLNLIERTGLSKIDHIKCVALLNTDTLFNQPATR